MVAILDPAEEAAIEHGLSVSGMISNNRSPR